MPPPSPSLAPGTPFSRPALPPPSFISLAVPSCPPPEHREPSGEPWLGAPEPSRFQSALTRGLKTSLRTWPPLGAGRGRHLGGARETPFFAPPGPAERETLPRCLPCFDKPCRSFWCIPRSRAAVRGPVQTRTGNYTACLEPPTQWHSEFLVWLWAPYCEPWVCGAGTHRVSGCAPSSLAGSAPVAATLSCRRKTRASFMSPPAPQPCLLIP